VLRGPNAAALVEHLNFFECPCWAAIKFYVLGAKRTWDITEFPISNISHLGFGHHLEQA
jgi:hypothetical protein